MSEELEISVCDSSGFAEGLCQRNTLIVEGSCDFNCLIKIFVTESMLLALLQHG